MDVAGGATREGEFEPPVSVRLSRRRVPRDAAGGAPATHGLPMLYSGEGADHRGLLAVGPLSHEGS